MTPEDANGWQKGVNLARFDPDRAREAPDIYALFATAVYFDNFGWGVALPRNEVRGSMTNVCTGWLRSRASNLLLVFRRLTVNGIDPQSSSSKQISWHFSTD